MPTNRAVIQKGLLLREDKLAKEGIDAKNYSVKEISRDLAPLVEAQWRISNLNFSPPVTVSRRWLETKKQNLY